MLKVIGMMMVFAGCSWSGIYLDLKYRKRIKELENLIYAFEYLKGEINYRLTPLHEACLRVGIDSRHEIGQLFICFAKLLRGKHSVDGNVLWQEAIKKERYRYHLNNEDYQLLSEFGRGLGHMDKEMQQGNIDLMQNKLKLTLDLALKEQERSSKLRTGMGILVGACLCILII
ncbi:MAG: stage III sporulation protein AB [Niameybacter sp.]|uniref:stage III sporulation protein AB n=1 Tax=Niameybacter sp. TaxID=2033640 RepID=UPI002FCCAFCC